MKKILIFLTIVTVSCNNNSTITRRSNSNTSKKDTTQKLMQDSTKETESIEWRRVVELPDSIVGSSENFKQYIINVFSGEQGNIETPSINRIDFITTINIYNFGLCKIFRIELINVPSSEPNKLFIVTNEYKKKAVLFPISVFTPYKIKDTDSSYFIAGTYISREKGFFIVYDCDSTNYFYSIFNSLNEQFCKYGIPVYNSSLDCLSYENYQLSFFEKDVNNDGINDLEFDGKINIYCKGLEKGIGRIDRSPLEQKKIKIQFLSTKKGNRISWSFPDSTICKIIAQ